MKDYTIKLKFNQKPIKPYEWDNASIVSNIKIIRVLPKVLKDILVYESYIENKDKMFILSDGINSIAVRLGSNNKVVARSYLSYEDDLEVERYISNIKRTNLKYKRTNKKIICEHLESYETIVKNYLIKSIKDMEDDKSKYMYYLYFNNIDDYSKEKLIKSITQNKSNKFYKLYNFLIHN